MARIKGMKVHAWINYPTSLVRKCTRCGIIKRHINLKGTNTIEYRTHNGKITTEYVPCVDYKFKYEQPL